MPLALSFDLIQYLQCFGHARPPMQTCIQLSRAYFGTHADVLIARFLLRGRKPVARDDPGIPRLSPELREPS